MTKETIKANNSLKAHYTFAHNAGRLGKAGSHSARNTPSENFASARDRAVQKEAQKKEMARHKFKGGMTQEQAIATADRIVEQQIQARADERNRQEAVKQNQLIQAQKQAEAFNRAQEAIKNIQKFQDATKLQRQVESAAIREAMKNAEEKDNLYNNNIIGNTTPYSETRVEKPRNNDWYTSNSDWIRDNFIPNEEKIREFIPRIKEQIGKEGGAWEYLKNAGNWASREMLENPAQGFLRIKNPANYIKAYREMKDAQYIRDQEAIRNKMESLNPDSWQYKTLGKIRDQQAYWKGITTADEIGLKGIARDEYARSFARNTAMVAAFGFGEAYAPKITKTIMAGIAAQSGKGFIDTPTSERAAATMISLLPFAKDIAKGGKTALGIRVKDTMQAQGGDQVPLRSRIAQIKEIFRKEKLKTSMGSTDKTSRIPFNEEIRSPDYTGGIPVKFATTEIGGIKTVGRIFTKPKWYKPWEGRIETQWTKNAHTSMDKFIEQKVIKGEALTKTEKKAYYEEVQRLANEAGEPLNAVSPKTLEAFPQSEAEVVRIFPKGYKEPKLNFQGFDDWGSAVYGIEKFNPLRNWRNIFKSRQRYFDQIAREKEAYLAGERTAPYDYPSHGIEHLKQQSASPQQARDYIKKNYPEWYEKHDITKQGEGENFLNIRHGETGAEYVKRIGAPKEIVRAIAEHDVGRPTLRSLYREAETGKLKIPKEGEIYNYLKRKIIPNKAVEDFYTLDRLDMPRFEGARANPDYLNKKALERIFGKDKIPERYTKKLTKEEIKRNIEIKRTEEAGRKYTEKYEREYGTKYKGYKPYEKYSEYKTPYQVKYEQEMKTYNPISYKQGQTYDVPYWAYIPYIEQTIYPRDSKYTSGGNSGGYQAPSIIKPIIPQIVPSTIPTIKGGKVTMPKIEKEDRKVVAWKPIMMDESGNTMVGMKFATNREATMEGMRATDETRYDKFEVVRTEAELAEIRRGRPFHKTFKFQRVAPNVYREKRYHQFDSRFEKEGSGFNLGQYMLAQR